MTTVADGLLIAVFMQIQTKETTHIQHYIFKHIFWMLELLEFDAKDVPKFHSSLDSGSNYAFRWVRTYLGNI